MMICSRATLKIQDFNELVKTGGFYKTFFADRGERKDICCLLVVLCLKRFSLEVETTCMVVAKKDMMDRRLVGFTIGCHDEVFNTPY